METLKERLEMTRFFSRNLKAHYLRAFTAWVVSFAMLVTPVVPFGWANEPVVTNEQGGLQPVTSAVTPDANQAGVPETHVNAKSYTELQDPTAEFMGGQGILPGGCVNPLPKGEVPEGTREAIAKHLAIDAKDVIDVRFIRTDDPYRICFEGCPVEGYLDVSARVGGKSKHYAGTFIGESYDFRYIRPDQEGVIGIDRLVMVPPQVYLIETELEVEAVVAIAKELKVELEDLKEVYFKGHAYEALCFGSGCPEWSGDLRVTVQQGENPPRFFKGEISKIFQGKEPYQVTLEETPDDPALLEKFRKELIDAIDPLRVEAAQTLQDLYKKLDEAEKKLREAVEKFNTDFGKALKGLKDVMEKLRDILKSEEIQGRLRDGIERILNNLDRFLDSSNPEGLDTEKEAFLKFLETSHLAELKAEFASWLEHGQALDTQFHKIRAAKTLADLEKLSTFPTRLIPPAIWIERPSDPLSSLSVNTFLVESLLVRAEEEIQVRGFIRRLEQELGKGYQIDHELVSFGPAPGNSPDDKLSFRGRYRIKIERLFIVINDGPRPRHAPVPPPIFPSRGRLTEMTFEVTVQPGRIIDYGSNIQIDAKTIKATYFGRPAVDGAMLYEGLRNFDRPIVVFDAHSPIFLREPSPEEIIGLMAKIELRRVDSNGTIHFAHKGLRMRIVKDETGKVRLELDTREVKIQPRLKEMRILRRLYRVIQFKGLTATMDGEETLSRAYQFKSVDPGTARLEFTLDPCNGNPACKAKEIKASVIIEVGKFPRPLRAHPGMPPYLGPAEVTLKEGVQRIRLWPGESLKIILPGSLNAGNLVSGYEKPKPGKPIVIVPIEKPRPLPVHFDPFEREKKRRTSGATLKAVRK